MKSLWTEAQAGPTAKGGNIPLTCLCTIVFASKVVLVHGSASASVYRSAGEDHATVSFAAGGEGTEAGPFLAEEAFR